MTIKTIVLNDSYTRIRMPSELRDRILEASENGKVSTYVRGVLEQHFAEIDGKALY